MASGVNEIGVANGTLTPRLVSALYIEAMVLADEVRGYFDGSDHNERDSLPPLSRVTFSCESLKVTTRLMHIIAWLLTQRAVEVGEITPLEARQDARRLGDAADSDEDVLATLPDRARLLIGASRDLYQRVARLDGGLAPLGIPLNPAQSLLKRLEAAF